MDFAQLIEWYLENINYWTIAILMAIESSFIPFPSEVVVPPAAYKAAEAGSDLNLVMVFISATIGALIGALVNYALAYYLGRPIIYKLAESRFGHAMLLSADKVRHAEEYFNRHGAVSTIIGRLVPAVRQLISLPAGLAKMPMGKFILYTCIGAGAWNLILLFLGWWLHSIVPQDELIETVNKYSHEIGLVFIVVAVCIVAYLAYQSFKKKKDSKKA